MFVCLCAISYLRCIGLSPNCHAISTCPPLIHHKMHAPNPCSRPLSPALPLQLLEGLALGSTAVEAGLRLRTTLILALAFAFTTPVGIAAGIGVRNSLNASGAPMLLTTGILDSISAGTLIFLALGDHMNAVRAHAPWLQTQPLGVKLMCFAAFFTGASALMVIAIWA